MRKGVVDIRRRVEVCLSANARYLDALAVVGDSTPSHRVLDPVSQPVITQNRRFRALQPISPADSRLFQHILSGEHLLQGFRNCDLRRALFPHCGDSPDDPPSRFRSDYAKPSTASLPRIDLPGSENQLLPSQQKGLHRDDNRLAVPHHRHSPLTTQIVLKKLKLAALLHKKHKQDLVLFVPFCGYVPSFATVSRSASRGALPSNAVSCFR